MFGKALFFFKIVCWELCHKLRYDRRRKNEMLYKKIYPRPQFVRKEWESLNGEWNFIFDDNDEGETKGIFLKIFQ